MQKECQSTYNDYMSDIILESGYETDKKKKLFSYIKSLRADFCGVLTLKVDSISHHDNLTKANLLNKHFSSVLQRMTIPQYLIQGSLHILISLKYRLVVMVLLI